MLSGCYDTGLNPEVYPEAIAYNTIALRMRIGIHSQSWRIMRRWSPVSTSNFYHF